MRGRWSRSTPTGSRCSTPITIIRVPSLAEDFMLLVLDDESGRPVIDSVSLDHALAGAVLLELVNSGRVSPAGADDEDVKEGRLLVRDDSATGDAVLDDGLSRLEKKPVSAKRAVELLVKGTRVAVLGQLSTRGLITTEKSKVLGVFPRKSWPALDTEHEGRIRERLNAVLLRGEQADPHISSLVVLLSAIRAVHKIVEGDKSALKARAKEVAEGDFAGPAVKKAIASVHAATANVVVVSGGS
ncbi:GPP34 family phosphoprotein [Saccharopolyspora spinosporotrichia]